MKNWLCNNWLDKKLITISFPPKEKAQPRQDFFPHYVISEEFLACTTLFQSPFCIKRGFPVDLDLVGHSSILHFFFQPFLHRCTECLWSLSFTYIEKFSGVYFFIWQYVLKPRYFNILYAIFQYRFIALLSSNNIVILRFSTICSNYS